MDPLELEFQVIVRHLMWVLKSELRSSVRAVYTLNHRATLHLSVLKNEKVRLWKFSFTVAMPVYNPISY